MSTEVHKDCNGRVLKLLSSASYIDPASGLINPDMSADEMRLHFGEMTPEEILIGRSAIRWANRQAQQATRMTLRAELLSDDALLYFFKLIVDNLSEDQDIPKITAPVLGELYRKTINHIFNKEEAGDDA